MSFYFFFFNDTATTEIYTLSLHDALPIFGTRGRVRPHADHIHSIKAGYGRCPTGYRRMRVCTAPGSESCVEPHKTTSLMACGVDRKSTRLNSSHANISYAVFCLKKKNNKS